MNKDGLQIVEGRAAPREDHEFSWFPSEAARSATWCARAAPSRSSLFSRHLHLEYRSDLRGNGGVLGKRENKRKIL